MNLDYHALAPELVVAATILVVLTLDVVLPRSRKYWTAFAAVLGLAIAALPLLTLAFDDGPQSRSMMGGGYVVDEFALVLKAVFIVGGYLVLLMSVSFIESDRYYQGEYYLLMLTSILGSLVMASSRDLITLFVGLELVTGPLFLLAGWRKGDSRSNEAALKFFILGVLSTAILLYGMSFLYGLTGSVTFEGIRQAAPALADSGAFRLAVLFTIVGFGFKVTAVPFHFWAPDTYQGAPTPVTAYLSVGSKTAGFVGLMLLCYQALPAVTEIWGPALWILAALSMTLGNLTALRQDNVVRLLAYSSIAQGGFILVPFAAAAVSNDPEVIQEAASAIIVYVIIYAFMNLGAFGVVIAGARRTGSVEIDDWAGMWRYSPRVAVLGAVFFFSLAGIPPLAGWYAKFVMFLSILRPDNVWTTALAVIAAVNAVIALVYYARIGKTMWMDPVPEGMEPKADSRPLVGSLALALGITALFVGAAGVLPYEFAGVFADLAKTVTGGI
ncbi:MAG: NADH-quinone oxidoreductase subunit N [Acidimicrobiia bacterium]|nr:NADH-quinone oxidoreductase subunit N [bacterium]MXZ07222.1 NADH-quinone oxidoreductase subunit N [Acidimicrobiia bacterium]MYF26475.1 NADH-quinone oxidoreductase subunit N [Acidimicrobiia bacterium]